MWVRSLGQEDPLEEGMATHSSILAWRIPQTEKPGALKSRGHEELDTPEVTQHAHARASHGMNTLKFVYLRLKLLFFKT